MKKNTLISILAISLSLLFTSCLKNGNGELITKTVAISDFSKIEISTRAVINYSQEKNTGELTITVDENLWKYYDVYTKNDVLYIKLKKEYKNNASLKPTQCIITVSSEQLEKIDLAGSAEAYFCTAFTSKELEIELSGSGKIVANNHPVNIQELKVDIAGSADIFLVGEIKKATFDISGSGDVEALECKISHLKVDIAGSGNITAEVTDKLEAKVSGSGTVQYKGNPEVKTEISGSGKVIKL